MAKESLPDGGTEESTITADQTSFGGIHTFLRAPHVEPDELSDDVDAAFVGVPFDMGATMEPGARHGPTAVRKRGSWHGGHHGFNTDGKTVTLPEERLGDYSKINLADTGDAPVVLNDIERTRDLVADYVEEVAEKTMPIIFGGDHYLTYPSWLGYSRAVEEDIGIVHLDAHRDVTSDSPVYGKHYHGSPMARIDEEEYGSYDRHAMVGLRGHARPGFLEIKEERDLYVDYAEDVEKKGIEECMKSAIDHATAEADTIYVTVDVDFVDPGFAPGTGTPQHGGPSAREFLKAMDILGECDAVGAIDVMELAPDLDDTNTTSLLMSNGLSRFVSGQFHDQTS